LNTRARTILTIVGIIAILGLLAYAANTMNLAGMLIDMHAPPQH
jgi:hypothetical protein